MPDSSTPAKAELRELDADFKEQINDDRWVTVQFNPESLKVSFANQIATPGGSGSQSGTPQRQFVGAGTTKLTLAIFFDVTSSQLPQGSETEQDVRKLTQKVAYFITPKPAADDPTKFLPPAVRFLWGSFQFDGMMDSLEESLEFFSPEGRPLRAGMTLNLSQQKIKKFDFGDAAAARNGAAGSPASSPGNAPLTEAKAGQSLPAMAAALGKADQWQAVAQLNGIENPRLLPPGQLVDFNVTVKAGVA